MKSKMICSPRFIIPFSNMKFSMFASHFLEDLVRSFPGRGELWFCKIVAHHKMAVIRGSAVTDV